MERELRVRKIRDGTVIDHLKVGTADDVVKLLRIDPTSTTVIIAYNVESEKYGRKDILKIEGKYITKQEADRIALLSPTATINIIREWRVVEKREVEIPRRIEDLITCPNPNCISNSRKEHLASEFRSFEFESKLYFQCAYCDYLIERKDISKYMKRLS